MIKLNQKIWQWQNNLISLQKGVVFDFYNFKIT